MLTVLSVDDKLSLGCGDEVSASSFKHAAFIVTGVASLEFSSAKAWIDKTESIKLAKNAFFSGVQHNEVPCQCNLIVNSNFSYRPLDILRISKMQIY